MPDDHIFGSLSTVEQRLGRYLNEKRGVRHLSRLTPMGVRPHIAPTITVTTNLDQTVTQVQCTITQPEAQTIPLTCVRTEWDLLDWHYVQVWEAVLPARPDGTLVWYEIAATTADGEQIAADDGAPFAYHVGDPEPPAWSRTAVMYQLLPDRYHPGAGREWRDAATLHDVYGGTLAGILENLDHIIDLGFNCLWINPFFPDDSHHGYHATDYLAVNPRLGTLDEMRQLVTRCHENGVRLILDFVANHWGAKHATFVDAQNDPDSPYHDWYRWYNWPDEYEMFYQVRDLPQLNVDNRAVRQHLIDAAVFWLTEIGFDGLRLDYAAGPSLAFWAAFRAAVKRAKPEMWLFGEVIRHPDDQLSYTGRLDGTLDFILAQAIRQTFGNGQLSLTGFVNLLDQHEAFFPAGYSLPCFLDNHDMNRFAFMAGGDKRRVMLAAQCLFTLSQPPIVYYGTEVGVGQSHTVHGGAGTGLAECRQPMLWADAQDSDLLAFFRDLIAFRHAHPVLVHGGRRTLYLDEATQVWIYERYDEIETVTAALNLSEQSHTVTVDGRTFTLRPLSGTLSA